MRSSSMKLYAPFLALVLAQVLIMIVAPSKGPDQRVSAGNQFASSGDGSGSTGDGSGGSSGDFSTGDASGDVGTGGAGTGGTGGDATGGGSTGGSTGGATGGAAAGSDLLDKSVCVSGKQFNIFNTGGPDCVGKWKSGANNGGATYQGVTKDTIKVIFFSATPNEQVNAILQTQGLAATEQETEDIRRTSESFLAKRYEFYGRKIEYKYITGDCPTTPPDEPKCIAAAQAVVKEKPFMVVWGTALYASVYDVWTKAGIVSVGGEWFARNYYTERRPYRYGLFMDGTQSAEAIADYYCKKMAKGTATHAGRTIHPTIGGRTTPRKIGVITPEIEANTRTGETVIAKVKACGGQAAKLFTYKSDINSAATQTSATVAGLINEKVTTVVCMCDPIAPVFLTAGMSSNSYLPEFLLPGLGLIDYDVLGRLYDAQTMAHAFGPSQLANPWPFDQNDVSRMWRDVRGTNGKPCAACPAVWAYYDLIGRMLMYAGPNLTPLSIEQGLFNAKPFGGTPNDSLIKFGQGDYNGVSDLREVYWSAGQQSTIDNKSGAYVPVNGGQRYGVGAYPANGLAGIPVASN